MNVQDRLRQFIKSQSITIKAFENSIEASNGYVNSVVNSIGPKYLPIILEKYPILRREWLLFGEGPMLRTQESNASPVGNAIAAIPEALTQVRFFEVSPTATFQEFCSGVSERTSTLGVQPEYGEILDDSYCVFEIFGDSMAPQIQNRARVLCREVPTARWHSLRDSVVVIAYGEYFVIKRIIENHIETDNCIVLASDNPDYPEQQTVPLCDIRCIFRAVRIVSQSIS